MHIEVKCSGEVIYLQKFDDSKTLNATIAHLMEQPKGGSYSVTVTNNGHPLPMNLASIDMRALVAVANGPTPRKRTTAETPAS